MAGTRFRTQTWQILFLLLLSEAREALKFAVYYGLEAFRCKIAIVFLTVNEERGRAFDAGLVAVGLVAQDRLARLG